MRPHYSRAVHAWVVNLIVGLAIIGSMVANAWYTQHVAANADHREAALREQADRRWCDLFALLDPAAPPTTDRGRQVQAQIRFLQAAFHCKETPR